MLVKVQRHRLQFRRPATTSRDTLQFKDTWFISEWEGDNLTAIGEASPIFGLSPEIEDVYESVLRKALEQPQNFITDRNHWQHYPSIVFGVETFLRSRAATTPFTLFDTPFTQGQPQAINGLIWMGNAAYMQDQIEEKLQEGFSCIKLKIGALDWALEHGILAELRGLFPANQLEIRVDANGAFTDRGPLEKLRALADLEIHSIEQPIRAGLWDTMAELCQESPIPIALDEELIGVSNTDDRDALLDRIQPHFLILKPSLLGGWASCNDWIQRAEKRSIQWWATSALESNVGLNAIAQWISGHDNPLPQGLGTGGLYTNNLSSPLRIQQAHLCHLQNKPWDLAALA